MGKNFVVGTLLSAALTIFSLVPLKAFADGCDPNYGCITVTGADLSDGAWGSGWESFEYGSYDFGGYGSDGVSEGENSGPEIVVTATKQAMCVASKLGSADLSKPILLLGEHHGQNTLGEYQQVLQKYFAGKSAPCLGVELPKAILAEVMSGTSEINNTHPALAQLFQSAQNMGVTLVALDENGSSIYDSDNVGGEDDYPSQHSFMEAIDPNGAAFNTRNVGIAQKAVESINSGKCDALAALLGKEHVFPTFFPTAVYEQLSANASSRFDLEGATTTCKASGQ